MINAGLQKVHKVEFLQLSVSNDCMMYGDGLYFEWSHSAL